MRMVETRYLVCYDVPGDRRRTQLAKCLDGYGDRVQDSVFEAVLDSATRERMMADVVELLDAAEDRLAVYPLCAACAEKVVRLGIQKEIPGEETVFIV